MRSFSRNLVQIRKSKVSNEAGKYHLLWLMTELDIIHVRMKDVCCIYQGHGVSESPRWVSRDISMESWRNPGRDGENVPSLIRYPTIMDVQHDGEAVTQTTKHETYNGSGWNSFVIFR